MRSCAAAPRMPSSRCVRPAIMPEPPRRWDFASSTMRRSRFATRKPRTAPNGWRSSISMSISAGFDGHRRDPLGGLDLVEGDFAWATARLMEIAEKYAKGRIVSVLEGGYDLEGLARSAAAHVETLMGA